MQDCKSKKFSLHVLEENDIEECSDLISNVFANFDPWSLKLKYEAIEMKDDIKELLSKILEDKTTIIAKDLNGKIVGCLAGVKMTKFYASGSNAFSIGKDLHFDIHLEKMSYRDKENIWEEVEYKLTKETHEILRVKKEEDQAMIGRFFIISPDYFGTSLAKELVFSVLRNGILRGMKYYYAIIFNIKAVKILTKHIPAYILNDCKVTLAEENDNLVLDTFLFYADLEKAKSLLSLSKY
jgi:hypothetical protein